MVKTKITIVILVILLMGITLVSCPSGVGGFCVSGHTFQTYVSDNNATCLTDGTETAKCQWCDETDTRDLAGSAFGGHLAPGGSAATCTQAGNTGTGTCTREGCEAVVTGDVIPPLGHNFLTYVSNSCII